MVAPNNQSISNIRFPQSPFLDPLTGRPAREWVIWLQNPNLVSQTVNNSVFENIDVTNITTSNILVKNGISGGTF